VRLGDITEQGFPFYGGEFTYLIPLSGQTGARKLFVRLGMACALAELACGGEKKLIAFPPYEGEIERESGVLEVTAFLSRQNAFGQLHNAEVGIDSGPKKYRTYGNAWTYEYRLIKQGIEYIYID
jgi:hypothetical protein